MSIRYYPALLEPTGNGGFGVSFLDFPGCVTAGDSDEEVQRNAIETLCLHIEGMLAEGQNLPEPSRITTPLPDWLEDIDTSASVRMLVPIEIETRAQRVNIMIEEGLLDRIDRVAEVRGMTRSAFLAEGARKMLSG